LVTNLPMSTQVMEQSKEYHPGFAIKGVMLIMVGITVMDRSIRKDGERVGRPHGYKKNGKDPDSLLQCEEVVDPLDRGDLSGLEVKVAASLAEVI